MLLSKAAMLLKASCPMYILVIIADDRRETYYSEAILD